MSIFSYSFLFYYLSITNVVHFSCPAIICGEHFRTGYLRPPPPPREPPPLCEPPPEKPPLCDDDPPPEKLLRELPLEYPLPELRDVELLRDEDDLDSIELRDEELEPLL
jgi:hypothetical protein